MAPRKRKETPKPVSKEEEELPSEVVLPEEASKLIQDLEEQVKERVDRLLGLRSALQQSLKQEFSLQLLKLPKQVREMPLKRFKEQYGGNINSVLLEDMESRLAASMAASVPATSLRTRARPLTTVMPTQRKTRSRAGVAETPAVGMSETAQLASLMRAPRGNEVLYSKNGSPLGYMEQQKDQPAMLKTTVKGKVMATPLISNATNPQGMTTIVQRAQPGSRTGVADSVTISLKGGEQVAVNFDGGISGVPDQHKGEVIAHLKALEKFASSVTGSRRRR